MDQYLSQLETFASFHWQRRSTQGAQELTERKSSCRKTGTVREVNAFTGRIPALHNSDEPNRETLPEPGRDQWEKADSPCSVSPIPH